MGQGTALVSATVALRLPDGSSPGFQRLQRSGFRGRGLEFRGLGFRVQGGLRI